MTNKLKKRHDDIFDKRNEHLEKIEQRWTLPWQENNFHTNEIILKRQVHPTKSLNFMYKKNSVLEITKEMCRGINCYSRTFMLGKIDDYTYPESSSDFMIEQIL